MPGLAIHRLNVAPGAARFRARPYTIFKTAVYCGMACAILVSALVGFVMWVTGNTADGPNFAYACGLIVGAIAAIRCAAEDLKLPKGPWS